MQTSRIPYRLAKTQPPFSREEKVSRANLKKGVATGNDYYLPAGRHGRFNSPFGCAEIRAGGKELDPETGNYYYGARYYDPKISVWLSACPNHPPQVDGRVDPLAHKYPSLSPYVFTGNNPIMLVDPDGREPQRATSGTIQQALAYFKSEGLTTVNQIYEMYDNTDELEAPDGFVRYVYTEGKGWIDLRHYFGAIKHGEANMDSHEELQCMTENASCYGYEDLPSNAMGGDSPIVTIEEGRPSAKEGYTPRKRKFSQGDQIYQDIEQHFNSEGTTRPENAPNWRLIPRVGNRQYGDMPQNFTENEIDYTNFPPAQSSLFITEDGGQ